MSFFKKVGMAVFMTVTDIGTIYVAPVLAKLARAPSLKLREIIPRGGVRRGLGA